MRSILSTFIISVATMILGCGAAGGGGVSSDCCVVRDEPGCQDPDVVECVVDHGGFTCDTEAWTAFCVDIVDTSCSPAGAGLCGGYTGLCQIDASNWGQKCSTDHDCPVGQPCDNSV